MSRASRPVLEAEARNMFGRKENFVTFRTCCNEDTCYQRLVGWCGTIRTSVLENQPAKTSVESSSWSFTGLFERSFTSRSEFRLADQIRTKIGVSSVYADTNVENQKIRRL